jgi:putative endonuclease
MQWTVYILECTDGSLYTGITTDFVRRLSEHEAGNGARYTKGRGPFKLIYKEFCKNRSQASKRELQIKALPRSKKLTLRMTNIGSSEDKIQTSL